MRFAIAILLEVSSYLGSDAAVIRAICLDTCPSPLLPLLLSPRSKITVTAPNAGYFGVLILAGASLLCLQVLPESPMFMLLHEEKFPRAQILDALK